MMKKESRTSMQIINGEIIVLEREVLAFDSALLEDEE